MELSAGEEKLIEQVRNLDWGKVEVLVQNHKLKMLSVKRDVQLDVQLKP